MSEEHDYTNWNPLPIAEVVELLSELRAEWWVAGGYAIEMFVDRSIRTHGDTDILIKRDDQRIVQEHLSAWQLYHATYPGLKRWRSGEVLTGRHHDIWCRPDAASSWRLQIMLLDTDGDAWLFRNDPSIRGSIDAMSRATSSGIQYLSPEIQLLYKAKPNTLEKDQTHFEAAFPLLDEAGRKWLLDNIRKRFPGGHEWTEVLQASETRSGT